MKENSEIPSAPPVPWIGIISYVFVVLLLGWLKAGKPDVKEPIQILDIMGYIYVDLSKWGVPGIGVMVIAGVFAIFLSYIALNEKNFFKRSMLMLISGAVFAHVMIVGLLNVVGK